MRKDLLSGPPGKSIVLFALPMLLGNVFQQLYNIVDTFVVGRFMGETALASVSVAFPLMFIINAVSMGMTIGASVLLSQLFGAKQTERFQKTLYTTILTMAGLAVALTVLGQIFIRPILKLMGTPEDALGGSVMYLRIVFGGLIFTFAYNTCSAVLRSIGDSKTPLYFLMISSVLNTVLDVFFVTTFTWGVIGVAVATVLAQAVSSILCYIHIKRHVPYLAIKKENRVFERKILHSVLKFGVPTMVQQLTVSLSIMTVQGMVNQFGTSVMAGYGAASKIESVAMMPMFNISSALATFTAQNIGAGQEDRVKKGLRSTVLFACLVCGGLALIIHFFRYELIVLFLRDDANQLVYDFGCGYLSIVCLFYCINASYTTMGGILRGTGDTRCYMLITMISLAIRVSSSLLMLNFTDMGFGSIWWGLPIAWTTGLVLCYLRYRSGAWRKHAAVRAH